MDASTTPLMLSLKPCFSDLVFEGRKRIELRRRAPSDINGRDIFVYVSSPVMELRGGFRVGEVWSGTPAEIWSKVEEGAGVNKCDFDDYFAGQSVAHALEITEVWKCANPVSLSSLRRWFKDFVVPQSWRYVKPEECHILSQLKVSSEQETVHRHSA